MLYVALPADAENGSYGVLWVGHIARWMAVEDTFVILVVSDVEAGLLDFHIRWTTSFIIAVSAMPSINYNKDNYTYD